MRSAYPAVKVHLSLLMLPLLSSKASAPVAIESPKDAGYIARLQLPTSCKQGVVLNVGCP